MCPLSSWEHCLGWRGAEATLSRGDAHGPLLWEPWDSRGGGPPGESSCFHCLPEALAPGAEVGGLCPCRGRRGRGTSRRRRGKGTRAVFSTLGCAAPSVWLQPVPRWDEVGGYDWCLDIKTRRGSPEMWGYCLPMQGTCRLLLQSSNSSRCPPRCLPSSLDPRVPRQAWASHAVPVTLLLRVLTYFL